MVQQQTFIVPLMNMFTHFANILLFFLRTPRGRASRYYLNKKSILLLTVFSLTLGAMAQETRKDSLAAEPKKCVDLVKMSDSIMIITKDCRQMPLEKNYTFINGISVSTTGLVKMADGTSMQLKKGDAIDMNGKLMRRNKIKATF